MDFWNSLTGILYVEMTSADPVGLLHILTESGIVLQNVEFIRDLTLRCEIRRRDYRKLLQLTKKRGDILVIRGKYGLYWIVNSLRSRLVLLAGLAVLLSVVLYLPTRVLFVQVDGNETIPQRQILAAAESCGIRFWASRREVRSEQVKNELLGKLPQLGWAGVNTKGCVAVISVQERTQTEPLESKREVRSIVAAKDGVVESCTALEGNLLCKVGQVVQKGEILISGYTDLGICIRATCADGEIFARTREEIDVITLSQCVVQKEITAVKHRYSLLVGKKRINLWKDSGIWQGSCDRMYEEYYITLPGGFVLPVAFVRETLQFRKIRSEEADPQFLKASLKEAAQHYLQQQMVGGRILSASEVFVSEDGICRMEGNYLCSEMIGRVQTEKIGE